MKPSTNCLYLLVWLSLALVGIYSGEMHKYRLRRDCKIKSGREFIEISSSKTLMSCMSHNQHGKTYISVSWTSGTKSCLLSKKNTMHETTSDDNRSYEHATGWVCASKIKYPGMFVCNGVQCHMLIYGPPKFFVVHLFLLIYDKWGHKIIISRVIFPICLLLWHRNDHNGEIVFGCVCLRVCLSVVRIANKCVDIFLWNLWIYIESMEEIHVTTRFPALFGKSRIRMIKSCLC